jgi:osmotically-inducible protein OsmY
VSNEALGFDVEEELLREPRVDTEAIDASVEDGMVALTGTAPFNCQREAEFVAGSVPSVVGVDDRLVIDYSA